MKYHTHLLTLVGDGTGHWTFTPIASAPPSGAGEEADAAVSQQSDACASPTTPTAAGDLIRVLEEIRTLERRLEEAKVWEARVKELEEALQVRDGGEPAEGW
jgi:ATP-binding cassette subfamily D (ALD) long-chain fatty acid import protein